MRFRHNQVVGVLTAPPSLRLFADLGGSTAAAGIISARFPEGCCSGEYWTTNES